VDIARRFGVLADPPNGTGYHRYGQFLFEQPRLNMQFEGFPQSRAHFPVADFIAKYSLGAKLASNFMRVRSHFQ
jgi:phosphatidylethanolamine-binding protein (PEBP) family uncharacterized protein